MSKHFHVKEVGRPLDATCDLYHDEAVANIVRDWRKHMSEVVACDCRVIEVCESTHPGVFDPFRQKVEVDSD